MVGFGTGGVGPSGSAVLFKEYTALDLTGRNLRSHVKRERVEGRGAAH